MDFKKAAYIILISLTVISCKNDSLAKIDWLEGTWLNGENYEVWKRLSDGNLEGVGYSIKNGDTIIVETIKIIEKNNKLCFIPDVKESNQAAPVFKFIDLTDNLFIVENLEHDFPNYIEYKKISEDSIVASIYGVSSEKKKLFFPMKRIK